MDLGRAPALPGPHNWQNAAAAYATARALGIPESEIIAGIETYPGLAHRQELIAERDGIRFVNDSKATNADATAKALACYDPIYWILGGRPKETGLDGLEPYFPRIARAYLIGEAAADFERRLQAHGVATRQCGTLDRAVAAAVGRCRGRAAAGGGGAALAGRGLLRSILRFRGAGQSLPQPRRVLRSQTSRRAE